MKPRRHPAEVTLCRLADHYERWYDRFDGTERQAIGIVNGALDRIAGEDEKTAKRPTPGVTGYPFDDYDGTDASFEKLQDQGAAHCRSHLEFRSDCERCCAEREHS